MFPIHERKVLYTFCDHILMCKDTEVSTASHSEAATSKRKSNCYTVKEDDGKLFHDERVNLQLLLPSRGLVPAAGLCRKLDPNS